MNRLYVASTAIGSLALGACYMFRLNRSIASIGAGATGLAIGAYYVYQNWANESKEKKIERGIEKLYYQHQNFFSHLSNWEEVNYGYHFSLG